MKMQNKNFITIPGWYLGYTESNEENRVVTRMNDMGYESFTPYPEKNNKLLNNNPLYPNYVFIKFEDNVLEKFLVKVEGLIDYVSFDGHPVRLSELEVDRIKQKVDRSIEENVFI
ncbi:MAG: transcription termination/antitermination NusG family protein [Arcicella sp.]|jgi:transcription antitermination factor NusG|nr:transcription termination/antitermination NusG family protein [Arcicella sp.]